MSEKIASPKTKCLVCVDSFVKSCNHSRYNLHLQLFTNNSQNMVWFPTIWEGILPRGLDSPGNPCDYYFFEFSDD
mgnify:CR=1 FL=1